jgi:antitoxin (DNA-binding transcriptional repressor) of toxin-antitoxin stability system
VNFLTVRELTAAPKKLWEKLKDEGEITITRQGKPTAILVNIPEGKFDETLQAIKQTKFLNSLNTMRMEAESRGFLDDEEIEAEIQAARKMKKTNRYPCFTASKI